MECPCNDVALAADDLAYIEREPLEPVHVHVAQKKPAKDATKFWITKTGAMAFTVSSGSQIYDGTYLIQAKVVCNNRGQACAIRPVRDAASFANFNSQNRLAIDCREIEDPVISPASGTTFETASLSVAMSCASEGAFIRYTLDGKEPNTHAKKYTGPFDVTESCTIKAYAVLDDYTNSDVASFAVEKV